jgi:hypothetical protein
VGTEFKVMQELLRHSTLRSTLDVYTQAVTPANMQLRQRSCRWCFRAKRTQRHHRLYRVALQREDLRTTEGENVTGEKGHKKGHKNVPFWVLDGFAKISASALERMAGTTRLELATSAVTGRWPT